MHIFGKGLGGVSDSDEFAVDTDEKVQDIEISEIDEYNAELV